MGEPMAGTVWQCCRTREMSTKWYDTLYGIKCLLGALEQFTPQRKKGMHIGKMVDYPMDQGSVVSFIAGTRYTGLEGYKIYRSKSSFSFWNLRIFFCTVIIIIITFLLHKPTSFFPYSSLSSSSFYFSSFPPFVSSFFYSIFFLSSSSFSNFSKVFGKSIT